MKTPSSWTILELFNNLKNVSPDGKTTVVIRILYVEHFLRWEQVSNWLSCHQGYKDEWKILTESDSVVEMKSNDFQLTDWTSLNIALKYSSFLQFLVIFGLNLNDDITPTRMMVMQFWIMNLKNPPRPTKQSVWQF